MLESSEEIRATRARRDNSAVDPQRIHRITDSVAERRLILFRHWYRPAKMDVVRQHFSITEQERDSTAGSVGGDAKNRVHVLTQERHLGEVPLRIDDQFDEALASVGQSVSEASADPATLGVSSGNDLV